jgi:2-methylcitrate dehydratase PrpD
VCGAHASATLITKDPVKTNIETLACFTYETTLDRLPAAVVEETKRLMVDSIGCALGGLSHPKGDIGVKYAKLQGPGGHGEQATVIGSGDRVSATAAAFANGELMNALDFDAILPPGHVSPYVIPCALAAAESHGASGADLVNAVAIAHEMTHRIGKALDYLRDIKDGKPTPPLVFGYSSAVFGAAAAFGKLRRHDLPTLVSDLGIAGAMAPVNTQWSWSVHSPTATVKYGVTGAVTQAAMAAAYLAELGHTGDIQVLDDGDHGFRRQIGSARWQPEHIAADLGSTWLFPSQQSYKPFPHCRILHAPLEVLSDICRKNDIKPAEIESITGWVEGWVMKPLWTNRTITHVTQAQFSMAHGLALGAHGIPPGKRWQSPEVVFDPSVIALMDKVHCEVHPDYAKHLTADATSRPTRVEVKARGQTFVGETRYPKGTLSANPDTRMTDHELSDKFVRNAEGVLSPATIDLALKQLWSLETVKDTSVVMAALSGKR